jgi:arsenate reductase (glutaredoxin)
VIDMTTTLYGIPNCDTVKKARAWLDDHGVAYRFHDFKRDGVPAAALARWLKEAGRDRLVNRKGTMWRKLTDAERDGVVDDASAAALLTAQPSVIKRPVVEWADGRLSVGFDAALWAASR